MKLRRICENDIKGNAENHLTRVSHVIWMGNNKRVTDNEQQTLSRLNPE